MRTALLRAAAVVAVALALGAATALAAPPTDPPGRSGDAPGHQKGEGSPAVDPSLPGRAHEAAPEPSTSVEPVEPVEPALEPAPPEESPRYASAAGKPKVDVPPAAEAAPDSSVSAPGASGRHKLTICHQGHAITVDVHAARAHVDGHGDTYAVAGARGRVACPHSSSQPPAGPSPAEAAPPAADAAPVRRGSSLSLTPAEAAAPAPEPPASGPATGGVSAAARPDRLRGGTAAAIDGASLPFTGASLATLVLLGLGLTGAGAFVRRAARATSPASSRRR